VHFSVINGDDDLLYTTWAEEGGSGQPLAFVIGKGSRAPRAWELAVLGEEQCRQAGPPMSFVACSASDSKRAAACCIHGGLTDTAGQILALLTLSFPICPLCRNDLQHAQAAQGAAQLRLQAP
jgi:hypothetical protein